MNAAVPLTYEPQSDTDTSRQCGGACLSMVYRSLGKDIAQAEIWPAIARWDRFGSLAAKTHLMVRDALHRGFAAAAIQVRGPLEPLRKYHECGIRVILNHGLEPDARTGHYTVLADIDDTAVVLNDPLIGPARRLSHAELLDLWQRRHADSEIAGSVLIGIMARADAAPPCRLCGSAVPARLECPNCGNRVTMQPAGLFGCINGRCAGRMWNCICCPECDSMWNPGREESVPEKSVTFKSFFAQLDKFCEDVLSLPAAAAHPDIGAQLAFLAASRERLNVARAEDLAHRRARDEQLTGLLRTAQQKKEAHRKMLQQLTRPAPPLDADALGRRLLQNLALSD